MPPTVSTSYFCLGKTSGVESQHCVALDGLLESKKSESVWRVQETPKGFNGARVDELFCGCRRYAPNSSLGRWKKEDSTARRIPDVFRLSAICVVRA